MTRCSRWSSVITARSTVWNWRSASACWWVAGAAVEGVPVQTRTWPSSSAATRRLDQFRFQIVEVVVVEGKLALQARYERRLSCWSQSMTCARTSLKVTAVPPRVWSLSGGHPLWPILADPQIGRHGGQQARCDKAVRPASIASDSLPQSVSANMVGFDICSLAACMG